jgi:hypothetical protein
MQQYMFFFLQSIILFTSDILVFCATNYQLTYAVLVYYCILLIKKSSFIKIVLLFMLLSIEQWFFYGHSFLAIIHIPLTYIIWYRHHQYLYFNTLLFMMMCMASFTVQLLVEHIMLESTPLFYIYCKLCGIMVCTWYGMYLIHTYTIKAKKGR